VFLLFVFFFLKNHLEIHTKQIYHASFNSKSQVGGGRATTTQHITATATTAITPSLYFSNSATEGCRSLGGVST